jgi:hypothetical protein
LTFVQYLSIVSGMGRTLAIHWAATTHGTWLHGDPRGSWREGRLIGPNPYLEADTRARMSGTAVVLDETECALVAAEFGRVVRGQRHRVLAATIQATHIHLVLGPLREPIDTVIARLKRRSAGVVIGRRRAMLEGTPAGTAGLYSRAVPARRVHVPRSLWTAGKFPVYIFDEQHLANAIEYVRDHNRRNGMDGDPFDWIDPIYPAATTVGERTATSSICETLPF